ncbi:hypothetical protein JTE90_022783 [Oedothorax gibbosus]|uniref:Uncharacterized protein n=1 Tax=Oedothorax gibbosus TaxID=931172 RepID=A0AAV6U8Q4_9ARAC|nr:hypothetical protein JTE90_022783 [Oedothorax gibbosus]
MKVLKNCLYDAERVKMNTAFQDSTSQITERVKMNVIECMLKKAAEYFAYGTKRVHINMKVLKNCLYDAERLNIPNNPGGTKERTDESCMQMRAVPSLYRDSRRGPATLSRNNSPLLLVLLRFITVRLVSWAIGGINNAEHDSMYKETRKMLTSHSKDKDPVPRSLITTRTGKDTHLQDDKNRLPSTK